MIHRVAVLSICYFSDLDFNRSQLHQLIKDTMIAMGYGANNYNPEGDYVKGYKFKHYIDEETIEKYYKRKQLSKLLLAVEDLKGFSNKYAGEIFNHRSPIAKECHEIYNSLYEKIQESCLEISIMTMDIPIETSMCIDTFRDENGNLLI